MLIRIQPTFKTQIHVSLCTLVLVFCLGLWGSTNAAADPGKPNIVYILLDDLGYGDVSRLNPEGKIKTPQMDRIAGEGMIFTDAHSNSAVCTPTRYGVITGRYCWRTKKQSGVLSGTSEHLIPADRMTVASFLKQEGYHTAFIGKWHLGWDWAKKGKGIDFDQPVTNGPDINGFDYYYGICASLDMDPYVYVENGKPTAKPNRVTSSGGQKKWRKGETASDFEHIDALPNFTKRGADYIREQAKKKEPFFLYLPLPSPHTPILPTPEWEGKSGLDNIYADYVMMTDDCIGQIDKAIQESGIAENTIVIITSDNGCSPKADIKQLATKDHNPSYHFRGAKADIFEGGHRVPFIVRWPAKVKAGSVTEDTTCLTDLLATCADIVGKKLPDNAGEDSVSMLPNLLGTAKGPLREATVHHSINGSFAIRQGKWKLAFCADSGGWSSPKPKGGRDTSSFQLYDLENDIGEENNVVDQHPEVVKHLTGLMQKYVDNGRSTPGAPQTNVGKTTFLGLLKNSKADGEQEESGE